MCIRLFFDLIENSPGHHKSVSLTLAGPSPHARPGNIWAQIFFPPPAVLTSRLPRSNFPWRTKPRPIWVSSERESLCPWSLGGNRCKSYSFYSFLRFLEGPSPEQHRNIRLPFVWIKNSSGHHKFLSSLLGKPSSNAPSGKSFGWKVLRLVAFAGLRLGGGANESWSLNLAILGGRERLILKKLNDYD